MSDYQNAKALSFDVYDLRKKVESLKTCEAWLQKQVAERDETIAELNAALSRGWHWTDENLPGIDGRLLISVSGSCREGFYKNGKFTDKHGEQKPEAWMSLPMAPRYRNGQYVGY
jgi:hypothetical protein